MSEKNPEFVLLVRKYIHDIRSPLTSLTVLSHLLKKSSTPEQAKDLEVMKREIDKSIDLIQKLSDEIKKYQ